MGSSTGSSHSPTTSPASSSSLSAGAYAGIGVGATLAGLLVIGGLFFIWWKKRHAASQNGRALSGQDLSSGTQSEKAELRGDPGMGGAEFQVMPKSEMQTQANIHEVGGMHRNAPPYQDRNYHGGELQTNANRHEVEHPELVAAMSKPFSIDGRAELEGWQEPDMHDSSKSGSYSAHGDTETRG